MLRLDDADEAFRRSYRRARFREHTHTTTDFGDLDYLDHVYEWPWFLMARGPGSCLWCGGTRRRGFTQNPYEHTADCRRPGGSAHKRATIAYHLRHPDRVLRTAKRRNRLDRIKRADARRRGQNRPPSALPARC